MGLNGFNNVIGFKGNNVNGFEDIHRVACGSSPSCSKSVFLLYIYKACIWGFKEPCGVRLIALRHQKRLPAGEAPRAPNQNLLWIRVNLLWIHSNLLWCEFRRRTSWRAAHRPPAPRASFRRGDTTCPGVWSLGFGVWGLGFGVWGLGFRV